MPAAASRRVRDRLGSAPDGPVAVLHRSPHALYVDVAGWCVGVVGPQAAQVPCALRVPDPGAPGRLGHAAVERAEVVDGSLRIGGTRLVIGRLLDVSVPRPQAMPTVVATPGRAGAEDWVAGLVGIGDGLTPYGDDVLCGWLGVHRAAGVPTPTVDAAVRALLPRTTLLSATLLDCALHGEVLPQFAGWISALGTPREPAAAARLEAVGHSSGRGLLAGARRALAGLEGAVAA